MILIGSGHAEWKKKIRPHSVPTNQLCTITYVMCAVRLGSACLKFIWTRRYSEYQDKKCMHIEWTPIRFVFWSLHLQYAAWRNQGTISNSYLAWFSDRSVSDISAEELHLAERFARSRDWNSLRAPRAHFFVYTLIRDMQAAHHIRYEMIWVIFTSLLKKMWEKNGINSS